MSPPAFTAPGTVQPRRPRQPTHPLPLRDGQPGRGGARPEKDVKAPGAKGGDGAASRDCSPARRPGPWPGCPTSARRQEPCSRILPGGLPAGESASVSPSHAPRQAFCILSLCFPVPSACPHAHPHFGSVFSLCRRCVCVAVSGHAALCPVVSQPSAFPTPPPPSGPLCFV